MKTLLITLIAATAIGIGCTIDSNETSDQKVEETTVKTSKMELQLLSTEKLNRRFNGCKAHK